MDNKRIVFVVIYEWVNDNEALELFVYDTHEKAKNQYDKLVKKIHNGHADGNDFDVRTENVYDFEEDGDQMRREYFAYNEGSYYDEHYRVELRPKYVN